MGLFPKLKLKKQPKISKKDKKELSEMVHGEMSQYVSREELTEYYNKIQKDENKRRIWNSLPPNKKVLFLKYLAGRNRNGKK